MCQLATGKRRLPGDSSMEPIPDAEPQPTFEDNERLVVALVHVR